MYKQKLEKKYSIFLSHYNSMNITSRIMQKLILYVT